MNVADQLWLLKQIYEHGSSCFDEEKKMVLYQIPDTISAEELSALERMGHMPNQIYTPKHDEIMDAFYRLSGTWTIREASDAFIAGLWSEPFLWRSALTAKVMAMVMPPHEHTPYGNSKDTCAVCGYRDKAIDITQKWYFCMLEGTPLDGDPVGHVLALKEMEQMGKRPVPTEYDWWTFRAVLTVIRSMPPKTRYSKVRDALSKEKLLPSSKKWVYGNLLESLALIGILDTEDYPGMITKYTTYRMRDGRPNVRVEVQAPLAWWDSSVGINEQALKKIFPTAACPSVDLADRPIPIPSLSETITGQLEKRRRSRQKK
ncbi:MAG: hypothetical protein K2N95_01740 [Lachnospiraceae bacterium]|nr:hypothetical protein [Lachnospiraceae bacterium]